MRLILISFIILLFSSCNIQKNIPIAIVNSDIVDDTVMVAENMVVLEMMENHIDEMSFSMSENRELTEQPLVVETIENNRTITSTNEGGNVVYKIPTDMTVRSTYQVVVRISKSKVKIYENLNGAVKSSIISVTQTMEVNLIDSSPSDYKMFDIVPNNTGVQLVEDNEEVTQWTWDITPVRSGTSKLKIVISIIRDGVAKETVYEDTVVVRADVTKTVPFFISKYWQWIFSTLIIPIVIWYYKRKKKKEEEKKDENIN